MASEYYRVTDWETRLRAVSHAVGLVIAAFLLSVVTYSLGAGLVQSAGYSVESTENLPPLAFAALNASQFVGFFAAVAGYLSWREFPDLFDVRLPSVRDLGLVGAGFLALFALSYLIGVVFQAIGVESATNSVVEQGQQDPVRFLFLLPVTWLFVAPAEELLFRGVVQGVFRRAYGVVPALLFASLVFGLGHWPALSGTDATKLAYVGSAAALGLLLGTLYELSENIVVPIGAHGLWNSFLFVGEYANAV